MNKTACLCFECRALYKDAFDVEVYSYGNDSGKKCEHCGKKYDVKMCRIKEKKRKE